MTWTKFADDFSTRYIPMVGWQIVVWVGEDFMTHRKHPKSQREARAYGFRIMKKAGNF